MKEYPDLLGLPWDQAQALLTSQKLSYHVTEITEGIRTPVTGPLRVIRQREEKGIHEILVCKVPDPI